MYHSPGAARPASGLVHLRAQSVSVVIDVAIDRLPAILYWGAGLPDLNDADLMALRRASAPVVSSNAPELPPRAAVLPEHHTGWTGRPGLSGSFGGRGWSPRFRVVRTLLNEREWDATSQGSAGVLRVECREADLGLNLTVVLELTEHGLLRQKAVLYNAADEPYSLEDLSLTFPVPADASELLDFTGGHNNERVPRRHTLATGVHMRENRRGRTAADSAFVLHAGTPGFGFSAGAIWAVHTAWSGNHRHFAEVVYTGERLLGGGEVLLPGEVQLGPGESYDTPWVYGSYGWGLDNVARRFHRHLRSRAPQMDSNRPVTFNVWEAVYFEHDLERLLHLAELAAGVGAERFVLDDGWFGDRRDDRAGLGDWVVSRDAWPDGLHPLVSRVRELGMGFGLWFEPEMINLDSDAARAHPEWIMATGSELPVDSRNQQVLNLAIPAAYEHVRDQILALLEEYPIGYIKWDHNRDLIDAGDRTAAGRPGVRQQTLAFYRLLDEVRAEHPGLEIETCSSGGARIDLGVLEHTDRAWISDNIDPHDRQSILRWTTQLLPPEFMGSHIASRRSHVTGRHSDLSFRGGTALFGHMGIEWDLAEASIDELQDLRAWIDFYKQERALLLAGEVVRGDDITEGVRLHGVVSPDRDRAIFAVAWLNTIHPDPAPATRFRGLDPETRYHVEPVIVGTSPSGLQPPVWWGQAECDGEPLRPNELHRRLHRDVVFSGAHFAGAVLEHRGLAAPRIHASQVILYRMTKAS